MMKTYALLAALFTILTMIAAQCGAASTSAPAGQSGSPEITIEEPFARASIPNGAVYLNLVNQGDGNDLLLSAETDVAEVVELHETKMDADGVMHMSRVPNIEVPAGGSVTLEPGGLHIMLLSLKEEFAPGDKFEVTLNFENSGSKTIEVEAHEGMAGHGMK
jgi:copper(I)-binding protein